MSLIVHRIIAGRAGLHAVLRIHDMTLVDSSGARPLILPTAMFGLETAPIQWHP